MRRSTALVAAASLTVVVACTVLLLMTGGINERRDASLNPSSRRHNGAPIALEQRSRMQIPRSIVLSSPASGVIVGFPRAMRTLAAAAGYEAETRAVADDGTKWRPIALSAMRMPRSVPELRSTVVSRDAQGEGDEGAGEVERLRSEASKLRSLEKRAASPLGGKRHDDGSWQKMRRRGRSSFRGRTQSLFLQDGLEDGIDYLPDNDEDVRAKDAKVAVREIYRPFAPPGDPELNPTTSPDTEDYASFYRAYSAYQLPREASNSRGVGGNNLGMLGSENLPPHGYPYGEAYYPNGGGRASVTINANGAGSTNSFNVAGPGAINVNFGGIGAAAPASAGSGSGGDAGGGGPFIYPDGKHAVKTGDRPSTVVSGAPAVSGEVGDDGYQVGGEQGCDSDNLDCQFWQDAYDDAEW